jgi:hypothetical protein
MVCPRQPNSRHRTCTSVHKLKEGEAMATTRSRHQAVRQDTRRERLLPKHWTTASEDLDRQFRVESAGSIRRRQRLQSVFTRHSRKFLARLQRRDCGRPLTGLCQEAIAFFSQPIECRVRSKAQLPATRLPADSDRTRFLALLAANRIAPVTHQVQACRGVLRPPWRHWPPQRNVGAKSCPRGWSHWCGCRDGDASPQLAHGLGDSVICTPSGGTKAASNH